MDKIDNYKVVWKVEKETETVFTIQTQNSEFGRHNESVFKYEILRLMIHGKM